MEGGGCASVVKARMLPCRRRWLALVCTLAAAFPLQAGADDGYGAPSLGSMLGGGDMPGSTTTCIPCSTMTPPMLPTAPTYAPPSYAPAPVVPVATWPEDKKKVHLSPAEIGGIAAGAVGVAAVAAGAIAGGIVGAQKYNEKRKEEQSAQSAGFLAKDPPAEASVAQVLSSMSTPLPSSDEVQFRADSDDDVKFRGADGGSPINWTSLTISAVIGVAVIVAACWWVACGSKKPKKSRKVDQESKQPVSLTSTRSDTEVLPLLAPVPSTPSSSTSLITPKGPQLMVLPPTPIFAPSSPASPPISGYASSGYTSMFLTPSVTSVSAPTTTKVVVQAPTPVPTVTSRR